MQGDTHASSDARASGATLTKQLSTQLSLEGGEQDATQNMFVLQLADATSQSAGGLAGGASVVNCATVQQSSRQAIGSDATGPQTEDASAFCTPPAAAEPEPGAADTGSSPADAAAQEPVAHVADYFGDDDAPRHGSAHLRVTAIPASHAVTTVRQGVDQPLPAFVAAAPHTEDGLASEISTPTREGAAQESPAGSAARRRAGGKPALPSAPDSVNGAGSALPALGGGSAGGVADTPSRRYATPNGYRVAWAVPTVRRSEHYSGRFETPG